MQILARTTNAYGRQTVYNGCFAGSSHEPNQTYAETGLLMSIKVQPKYTVAASRFGTWFKGITLLGAGLSSVEMWVRFPPFRIRGVFPR